MINIVWIVSALVGAVLVGLSCFAVGFVKGFGSGLDEANRILNEKMEELKRED